MTRHRAQAPSLCVDPVLADLIPEFLENRRKDLRQLDEALVGADWKTVHRLGHNMKGSGRAYGMDEITTLGARLEEAASRRDEVAVETLVTALERCVDKTLASV
jgi:HPt (histidine-containing phosphotransfer) domain-containing protein